MIDLRRAPWSLRILLAFGFARLALGCHDHAHETLEQRENRETLVPDSMPSAHASSAPPTHPPIDDDAAKRTLRMESLVRDWNLAINAHDASLLAGLYDDFIELYGKRMRRSDALTAKKASFAKHARDDLSDIAVTQAGHAQFHKKSSARDGKVIDVTGYLDAREVGGKWVIVAEGDTETDTNLARAKSSRCVGAVMDIVYATAEAQQIIRDIEEGAKHAPADDPVSVGGMVSPEVDPADFIGQPKWTVAICENHKDRSW
jgi:hypothetical protein